jgi:hypothetical protein
MFYLFQTHVASVLIQIFANASHICYNNMFHLFHLFQMYVASVLFGCCIYYNDYVASVCSKCFIYFSRMLQLFHLNVAKVDLNMGLFSEEERTSVKAMAAAVRWRHRSTEGCASVRVGARGSFPYNMLPPLAPPEVLE